MVSTVKLLLVGLLSAGGMSASPRHFGGNQRWVSYWLSLSAVNATVALNTLRTQGGSKVATSLFVDCGDTILQDGSLQAGGGLLSPSLSACDSMLPSQLRAMGIGFERLIQSKGDSIEPLRAMFKAPQKSIDAIVRLAKAQKLRGISWDVEPETDDSGRQLTNADAVQLADYMAHLRAALSPLDVRLTIYTTMYSPLISNMTLLQHSVDRLLDGDTYTTTPVNISENAQRRIALFLCRDLTVVYTNTPWSRYVYSIPACGEPWFPSIRCQPNCNVTRCDPSISNFTKWLDHYHNTVVNDQISRDKAGIAMMATTEDGEWNCFPSSMRQRAVQLLADGVPELAIFELFPMAAGKCSTIHSSPHHCTCSDAWFPVARDFLAGRL